MKGLVITDISQVDEMFDLGYTTISARVNKPQRFWEWKLRFKDQPPTEEFTKSANKPSEFKWGTHAQVIESANNLIKDRY